jgi:aminopeptidase
VSSASDEYIEQLAELVVGFGANVQPGQIVSVSSEPGKERLVRAIAESAYARGARFVDVAYFDPHVKAARLRHADRETLSFVPEWMGHRVRSLGAVHAALISLSGPSAPRVLEGIDPERVGIDMLPRLPDTHDLIEQRLVNWSVVPCPTPGWAAVVHPDLAPDEGLALLWEQVARICRLDAADPVAAWRARLGRLQEVATALNGLALDAVRFEGPGTDLTVGLMGGSRWISGQMETIDGIPHAPNLPTEETWVTPDPARADGVVSSTKPLFVSGGLVTGLRMRFEGGRAVEIEAESGADTLRALTRRDEGASRLGEVALVDGDSRIGRLDTVFFDTLLDENAACHLALGSGYGQAVDGDADLARMNRSDIHIDFMIGADDVAVTGLGGDGSLVPLLRDGAWQI